MLHGGLNENKSRGDRLDKQTMREEDVKYNPQSKDLPKEEGVREFVKLNEMRMLLPLKGWYIERKPLLC